MKKNYLAPMSASIMVNLTIMLGSAAEPKPGGNTGTGEPALAPVRKMQ